MFIFPEWFLNFFPNQCIPSWLKKNYKFIMLSMMENTFVSQKIEFVHLYPCLKAKIPPQILIIITLSRRKSLISTKTTFFENLFFTSRTWEDYGAAKMTKIKLARVLVTSFNKFYHFCKLYIIRFCFFVL